MYLRTWRIAILAVTGLSVAAAGLGKASAQCLTVDKIKAKGGWDIVAELPDFEPYWFMDKDGKFAGMDVDLLNAVNKKLDIPTARYTTIPWEGVLPALLAKKGDFLPEPIIQTEERKKVFAFGHFYGDVGVVIMTRPDTSIKSNKDLGGKTVAAQTGSGPETALAKVKERYKAEGKDLTMKNYQGTADELLDLRNKRVDAVVASRPVLVSFMKKHPDEFLLAGLLGEPAYAAWAYRPEDMGQPGCIGTEINAALSQLRKEGVIAALQKKWFGEEFPIPPY
jgi:polar amino acid transport system substrate-binding protein